MDRSNKGPVWVTHQSESVGYIVSSKSPISDPSVVSVFLRVEFQAVAGKKKRQCPQGKRSLSHCYVKLSPVLTHSPEVLQPVSGSDVIGAWLYDKGVPGNPGIRKSSNPSSPGGGWNGEKSPSIQSRGRVLETEKVALFLCQTKRRAWNPTISELCCFFPGE